MTQSSSILPPSVTPMNRESRTVQEFLALKKIQEDLARRRSTLEATLTERIRQLEPACASARELFGTDDLDVVRQMARDALTQDEEFVKRTREELAQLSTKLDAVDALARQGA